MKLEYIHIGRIYRVKQGNKLLNLRLTTIQTVDGEFTDEKEIPKSDGPSGYRLHMIDETNGKGYTVYLSQVEDEVKERPKVNGLVQIVKGKLVNTLGSVTVYRVEKVDLHTVVIVGAMKKYELPISDVRVYVPTTKNPETLLSEQSKKIGFMSDKPLPPPNVKRSNLSSMLGPKSFGSISGIVKRTKEQIEAERLAQEEKRKSKREKELEKERKIIDKQLKGTDPTIKEMKYGGGRMKVFVISTNRGNVEEKARNRDDACQQLRDKGFILTEDPDIDPKATADKMEAEAQVYVPQKKQSHVERLSRDATRSGVSGKDSGDEGVSRGKKKKKVKDVLKAANQMAKTPEYLADVSIPMEGNAIDDSYWEQVEQEREQKNSNDGEDE